MNQLPIWRLLEQCAHKLTEAGRVPFTRADLIECVREREPNANPNAINPIIQGITDNLKGGAPGAVGKNILHSVVRGKFVMRSDAKAERSGPFPRSRGTGTSVSGRSSSAGLRAAMPATEGGLRDQVLARLRAMVQDADCHFEAEGRVLYRLPDGKEMRHASDILITTPDSEKQISIEIKYRSAVTDQFKCRAYDALHMKQQHRDEILTVMLFARADSGIGIERARSICHPFDRFYGDDAASFLVGEGLDELVGDITEFL